jgi:hypothetical protein
VFCGECAGSIRAVPSQTMEEALKVKMRIETLLKAGSRRNTHRAKALAFLGIGLLLFLGGVVTLFSLDNVIGVFLMIIGFLFLGTITGLFEGTPYRSRVLNWARRREDERRRRREVTYN